MVPCLRAPPHLILLFPVSSGCFGAMCNVFAKGTLVHSFFFQKTLYKKRWETEASRIRRAEAIVERVQSMGMTSRGYDIGFHEDLDLTTCAGFLFLALGYICFFILSIQVKHPRLALILVRRVRPGGLCVFAPVCSLNASNNLPVLQH